MKIRHLALVLFLAATSAVLVAAHIGEHDSPSQMDPGQSAESDKDMGRGPSVAASATEVALGTSVAEWNRRNPMKGF